MIYKFIIFEFNRKILLFRVFLWFFIRLGFQFIFIFLYHLFNSFGNPLLWLLITFFWIILFNLISVYPANLIIITLIFIIIRLFFILSLLLKNFLICWRQLKLFQFRKWLSRFQISQAIMLKLKLIYSNLI